MSKTENFAPWVDAESCQFVERTIIQMETKIVKRDGKEVLFSIDKIKDAISKAFIASGSFATEETLTAVLSDRKSVV